MKTLSITLIVLAWVVIIAPSEEKKPTDSWFRPAPAIFDESASLRELEKDRYHEVVASKLLAAIEALKTRAYVKISESEAEYYCGQELKNNDGGLFLVRALYGNGATGGFHVFSDNLSIEVNHLSLGNSNEINRSALVVQLKSAPNVVFVTSNAAR